MIGRFAHWWASGLAAWLPRSVRESARGGAGALCLALEDETLVQVADHRPDAPRIGEWAAPGGAIAPGTVPPDLLTAPDAHARIRFSSSRALERDVELPIATEENLTDVLRFEMERLTPFRAADVYHRYRVLERDTAAGKLRLRLLVVPRTVADPVLALLGDGALEPGPAEQSGPADDAGLELEFHPRGERPARPGVLIPGLVIANAVLVVALALVAGARQDRVLDGLDTTMREARANATRADEARRRLEALLGAGEFLVAQRRERPAAVLLLDEVSALLPDGTSLTRLEIRRDEVHLHGISTSASALIALLDESEMVRGARFASPVLRDGASGRDRFHIAVGIQVDEASGG